MFIADFQKRNKQINIKYITSICGGCTCGGYISAKI